MSGSLLGIGLASFHLSFFFGFGRFCFLGMPLYEFGERYRAVYAVIDLIAVHVDATFVAEVERAKRQYAAPVIDDYPSGYFAGYFLTFIVMPYLVFVHSHRNGGGINTKGREKRGFVEDGYLLERLCSCVNV